MAAYLSWKVFKIAYLSTKEDSLIYPLKYRKLEKLSKTITHSRYDDDRIVKESYMCFYSHNNESIDVRMENNDLIINMIVDTEIVSILNLHIPNIPHMRYITREKKVLIKYFQNHEKKLQLSFMCLEDVLSFTASLNDSMKKNNLKFIHFQNEMNRLTGNVIVDEAYINTNDSFSDKELCKKFICLVNKYP